MNLKVDTLETSDGKIVCLWVTDRRYDMEDVCFEPKPHGEWIETFFTTGCSNCKEEFRVSGEWAKSHFHYCPNCGADMRGGDEK